MTELSIIVPVYNVERHVRPCIKSIFKQGLDEKRYEIIIINDGTPDRSMNMIADIISQHTNITVINQENQGISMARNNGMAKATGEFILFLDSDDVFIDNSIPCLLDKAMTTKADLIVADFIKMNDDLINLFPNKHIKQRDGRTKAKDGKRLFLQDLNPHYCCVWRTMYRREFLNKNNIRFIPNIYFEDVLFTHQCYLWADLCLRVDWLLIIYRRGHESITSSFNLKKAKDYCIVIEKLWAIVHEQGINEQLKQKMRDHVFAYFSLLFYALTSCKAISRSEKMSILYYLKESVPNLEFRNGVKQKIVNFFYQRMPSVYMTLRIFYANYLQNLFWTIGDTIRNKKN